MIQVLAGLMLLFYACPAVSSMPAGEVSKHSLLHIIDYIGTDYSAAVVEGKVINDLEYAEMSNFAETAPQLLEKLVKEGGIPSSSQLEVVQRDLVVLQSEIKQKKPVASIEALTSKLRDALIPLLHIEVTPTQAPSLPLGRSLYTAHCANCHGQDGASKTPMAAALQPPPFDFTDVAKMTHRSPSGFYHALITGVPGTGMPAFAYLTEHELWSLSFFLFGFQFPAKLETHKEVGVTPSLAELARNTDQAYLDGMKGLNEAEKRAQLQVLRTVAPYQAEKVAAASAKIEAALSLTLDKIAQAEALFNQQDYREADHRLLEGYLDGFEKLEGALSSTVPVPLLRKIEGEFLRTRTYARTGRAPEFFSAAEGLKNYIQHARSAYQQKIAAQSAGSKWGDFFASLLIILREGFEAFLLILALLALLRNVGARHAYRWIHAGWICAVIAGIAAYFVLEGVLHISGGARETIEAAITSVAVVLLFYTGFWLLNQSEQRKWQGFLKDKTCWCLDRRSLWSLFGISFIAVFREAAETVLFYVALFSTAQHPAMVGAGFVAGLLALGLLGASIIHFEVRIPMRKFFVCTSILMLVLSVVLAGKAVFELMQAGYIVPTPLEGLTSLDLLGIYPVREPLLVQGALVLLILVLALRFRRQKKQNG